MVKGSSIRSRSRWRHAVPAGVLLAVVGAATWLLAAQPARSADAQIEIRSHGYSPAALTVAVGTAVTWINHDEDVHTVTSTTDTFRSSGIDTDETFTYTFTQPGTYEYFCKLHPLMTARIVVR